MLNGLEIIEVSGSFPLFFLRVFTAHIGKLLIVMSKLLHEN